MKTLAIAVVLATFGLCGAARADVTWDCAATTHNLLGGWWGCNGGPDACKPVCPDGTAPQNVKTEVGSGIGSSDGSQFGSYFAGPQPRSYTLSDLDRMRAALWTIIALPREGICETYGGAYRGLCPLSDEQRTAFSAQIEDQLRTDILAGITPEALEAEEGPKAATDH